MNGEEMMIEKEEGRKEMFVSNLSSSIFVFICKPYGSVLIISLTVFLLRLCFTYFTSLSKPEVFYFRPSNHNDGRHNSLFPF